jgi:hypothetical protein
MGLKLGLLHRYVENRVLRGESEAMRAEVTGGWRGRMRGFRILRSTFGYTLLE